jgi:hypothetical protein
MGGYSYLSHPMSPLSASAFAAGVQKPTSGRNSRQPVVVAGRNDVDVLPLLRLMAHRVA